MGSSSSNDLLIAVLGVTGAGKTTFISKATGRSDMKIGHGLTSCTQEISLSRLKFGGKNVALIDTPGFDDTYKSDAEILELIAKFLAETYSQDMLLSGIILLQPISGNRVQGNERKRTRLFEKVCGPGAFSKVVIATTMWDDLKNQSQGNQRVEERRTSNDFWGKMVEHGAQIARHDNNPTSARKIIGMLLKNVKPVVLQMQTELAQNDGRVAATSAGRQLDSDLDETSRKLLVELQDLKKESARNTAALRAEMQELQQKLEDAQNERDRLRESKSSSRRSSCVIL
ncbi:P-loop containing nucleoside triphosphate hydrolase protein [Acephala macrosclerotiorum]|nr:P-loop containing nucleoside triphosphate hydrolase protein [Acephala macrosclerotiorum]